MIINNYNFFQNEFQKYKNALLAYKTNSQVFIDETFHPTNKIKETVKDLYDSSIIWKRVDEIYPAPLFKKEFIHHEYIQQGEIGDCYFITALMRIAKQPHLVEPLFEKELPDTILGKVQDSINIKCGAVVVYFRAFGRRTPVLIDTLIPTRNNEPIFNRLINNSKSPWSLLVEKAYAKLNGSYSNIEGGFFFDSIYSLYGYYNKAIYFSNKNTLDIQKMILQILNYQHYGCIMDASINETREVNLDDLKNHNLVTNHSYLFLKIRKAEDSTFFLLFNPWGEKIWNGDYSSDSNLWRPELKECLKNEPENGRFWMIDKDFFHYFNEIDVAKPLNPHWTVRLFQCRLFQLTDYHKMQNFAFQITSPIPKDEKFHFHLLIERRITDYTKYKEYSFICASYAHINGKKIINETDKKTIMYQKIHRTVTFSFTAYGNDDIVTFVIYRLGNTNVEENCYIRAICKYDFKIYDINSPDKLFPKCENVGAAFDNFTITAPTSALPLKETIVDSKTAFWFDKKFGKNDDSLKNLVKLKYDKVDSSHYSNQGAQINLDNYIFNDEKLMVRPKFICYLINEKKKGNEYVAYVSRLPISIVLNDFSEQLTIQRNIKYPSILNYYGYSEKNFKNRPNPVLILEYCKRGTLSDVLSMQDKCELATKGFTDWNNTKKMINLIGIALGMNYLHKHNIIHRNLRCSNIFLDENLYPKIGEFDESKMYSSELNHVDIDGPDYCIAPEFINSKESYSFPIDVYAYGMLFYHVISNKEPQIQHINIGHLYRLILKGEIPSLDIIPIKYHQFILNLWNKDQNKRPTFEEIIEILLNDQVQLWLDDVDKNEVEHYIHHFGKSLYSKKDEISFKHFVDKINIYNLKMIPYQQIITNELISLRLINDIKMADEIIDRNDINDNHLFLYRIGVEISNKLPKDCFNGLKYLKASALCGNEDAILFIIKKFCSLTDENMIEIGIELAKYANELDIITSFLFMADCYMNGKYINRNMTLAAIYFKIAADKGNINAMNLYANIIIKIIHHDYDKNDFQRCFNDAKKLIFETTFANETIYIKAQLVFDTIENDEATIFVARKYFEKAAQKGDDEADQSFKILVENHVLDDNVPLYFYELC